MDNIVACNVWLKFNIQFIHKQMSMRRFILQLCSPSMRQNQQGNESKIFWALRDVSLQVAQGEIVGLLGHNGAGKSTLLMALAGIYAPDRGSITVRGKVGTLLSLSGGFNPRLTGMENIRQSGIFLGLTPSYLEEKINQIVELADLGDFINAPMRTYSSGMNARLGFSIAMHMNPDIMLIDEVIDAGDQAFRQRSRNLLATFRDQGKTVVIATHNTDALRQFCSRVLLLEHGKIVANGPADEVIAEYDKRIERNG